MGFKIEMNEHSLRKMIKHYKALASEMEIGLKGNPKLWGVYQNQFNAEVNKIFQDIMIFEKNFRALGKEEKVYKLKNIFVQKIRNTFEKGDYINWSLRKPFGYAGDYKIIEDIYENDPQTLGFERLFDNYFMMSAISIAVRNRKNDFKRMLLNFMKERRSKDLRIMSLACGPSREIRELFIEFPEVCNKVIFDCYDNDESAINFSRKQLEKYSNVNFFQENACRIAFRKNVHGLIPAKYDLIYSTGLFDYFEDKISIRLIENLRRLLNPHGVLMISDVRDKYSNPSVHFMEWVGEWELIYRDDESFRRIFYSAGYKDEHLSFSYEQQGILQYAMAKS